MPASCQVKLLRAVEEREVLPVGSTEPVEINVRVIAATNKILSNEIEEGRFREDLYYRLNVVGIHLPPLRERKEDIPSLVSHFMKKYNIEMGKEWAARLMGLGFAVYSPHSDGGVVGRTQLTLQQVYDMSKAILAKCDAMFVMPNSHGSPGTQAEIVFCKEHGIRVFHDIEALCAWNHDELAMEGQPA